MESMMNQKVIRFVFFVSDLVQISKIEQNVIDWDADTIVGTSKEIFKDYLRLTSVSFVHGLKFYLTPLD